MAQLFTSAPDTLNPLTWSGFEVVGGTAGASSPWVNQGGTLAGGVQTLEAGASSLAQGGSGLAESVQGSSGSSPATLLGAAGAALTGSTPAGCNPLDPTTWGTCATGSSGGNWTTAIDSYFVRAVVVILGFVFVAAGLSLMGRGGPVEAVLEKVAK